MRLLALASLLVLSARPCSSEVRGYIRPEHFRFVTLVKDNDKTLPGGGDQGVCLHAWVHSRDTDSAVLCDFEVHLPLRTQMQGAISLTFGQKTCAELANLAAYEVFSEPGASEMLGIACQEFRDLYGRYLDAAIPGARVKKCLEPRLVPVKVDGFSR